MMELIIRNDYEQAMPLVTITNFDELYTELSEQLERYNNLLITEDTIRDGKADRAKLNKLREALETRRKEIKKQCAEPYNAFEKKVKELTALIDKPIAAIDAQLAAYEDQRKEEKVNEREAEPPKPRQEPPETPQEAEMLYKLRLEFQLTKTQAAALKQFLADNFIRYNKI